MENRKERIKEAIDEKLDSFEKEKMIDLSEYKNRMFEYLDSFEDDDFEDKDELQIMREHLNTLLIYMIKKEKIV